MAESGHVPDPMNLKQIMLPEGSCGLLFMRARLAGRVFYGG